jgi:diguanylate cyclase (GGDEF)-like protein
MIICDIDHFKGINDTFGHQAGDEALTCFGALLRRHARAGDLVARYGGEEFVILCADCDNATATRRAEELRRNLAGESQPSLAGRSITASFGVTEIQGGDTPETFLRRADRALLQAKDNGRNIVVQLGTGIGNSEKTPKSRSWLDWLRGAPADQLLVRRLVTVVPLTVAAEKLRGFVADHGAVVSGIEENRVTLKIDEQNAPLMRRWNDRPVPFLIELSFEEIAAAGETRSKSKLARTLVHVVVRPKRQRDRRRRDAGERAQQLLVSLMSYMMAHDDTGLETEERQDDDREVFLGNTKQVLSYWLRK